jgi:hypothetical protein
MGNKYRDQFLTETSTNVSEKISDVQKEYVLWLEKRLEMSEADSNPLLADVRAFIKVSYFVKDLMDSHSVYHDEIDEWEKLLNKISEHFS